MENNLCKDGNPCDYKIFSISVDGFNVSVLEICMRCCYFKNCVFFSKDFINKVAELLFKEENLVALGPIKIEDNKE